ncbi:MAG: hypothetical protein EXR77_11090 [Myxococcales bacterium]|nr:hypothetical protein [Myxococcales bacterium]
MFCRDPLTASLVPCTSGTPVCPAGQVPAAAPATGCVPLGVPWHCPPGFEVDSTKAAVAPAPPPCKPDPTVCGSDEYGGVAPAANEVFVDGNAPAGGNGKRKTPFDTLQQALAAVPVGGTVAVAAGIYSGNLTLNKAMTLRGRCAALVRIDGGKGQVTLRFGQPAGSVVQVMGLQVTGARGGLFAQSAGETVATSLYVHSTRFMAVAGLAVGGKLLLQDSVVGPHASDFEPAAIGVSFEQGFTAHLQRVRIGGARGNGLIAHDPKTVVTATELLIDSTAVADSSLTQGNGIQVQDGASLSLTSCRLAANRSAGLSTLGAATQVEARGLLIDGTLPAADTLQVGIGANAISGGQLSLAGARLTGNRTAGLSVVDVDSQARAFGVRIDGTRAAIGSKGNEFGTGAIAYKAALLDLQGCRIDNNQAVGVYVADGPVLVRNSLILAGIPGKFPRTDATGRMLVGDVILADGVVLARSAPALFDRVVVAGHARACILADAGHLELLSTAATGCHFGLATQVGAQLVQKSVLLHGNTVNFSADGGLAVPTAPQVAIAGAGD